MNRPRWLVVRRGLVRGVGALALFPACIGLAQGGEYRGAIGSVPDLQSASEGAVTSSRGLSNFEKVTRQYERQRELGRLHDPVDWGNEPMSPSELDAANDAADPMRSKYRQEMEGSRNWTEDSSYSDDQPGEVPQELPQKQEVPSELDGPKRDADPFDGHDWGGGETDTGPDPDPRWGSYALMRQRAPTQDVYTDRDLLLRELERLTVLEKKLADSLASAKVKR